MGCSYWFQQTEDLFTELESVTSLQCYLEKIISLQYWTVVTWMEFLINSQLVLKMEQSDSGMQMTIQFTQDAWLQLTLIQHVQFSLKKSSFLDGQMEKSDLFELTLRIFSGQSTTLIKEELRL